MIHFRIVVPVYKSPGFVQKCIQSLRMQSHPDWSCNIIDDHSEDQTTKFIDREIRGAEDRFRVWSNDKRVGALANIQKAIQLHSPKPEDVIVTLDGDDWLTHSGVLTMLNQIYDGTPVRLTYGQFRVLSDGRLGQCREFPDDVKRDRSYRTYKGKVGASHLRTFRYELWRKIRSDDLIDPETGAHWNMAWDVAMLLPMMEMCSPEEIRCVAEVLYQYNDRNPLNDHKVDAGQQTRSDQRIRALPAYMRVPWLQ